MKLNLPEGIHLLHGADYNPDQWLDRPDILKRDIELMKEAHMNCVSVGIFAWARLEPKEGVYEFDWLEQIIGELYQNGIYTILATPSGAKPLWMSEKYEEIRRMSDHMVRDWSGERHNHCYTSPYYREKVRQIDGALARRFGKHPGVILWHLSNEYGGVCWCPLCQKAFRGWLQKKYGTLEQLNQQWWTTFWSHTYTSWEQIHAPVANGERGTHGLWLDWKRFTTDQVVDFMREESKAVRAEAPELPVTTNFMNYFTEYNYFKFKNDLDIVSWDSYPQWKAGDNGDQAVSFALWHDVMRSLKKQPFLLMESTPSATNWSPVSRLKRPGMHLAASMQAVAHGSDSVQYFQFRKSRGASEKFHGAVVDHYGGSDTREFRDVEALGRRLLEIGEVQGSNVKAEAALVLDVENLWAIEGAAGPRNCGMHYLETLQAHYKALWKMGVPVDVVDEECELSGYKLVIAPMLYLLRAGFEQKLRDFVGQGGTLVGTYHTGLVNENDLCYLGGWPGAGLMDLFGVWHETTDALYDDEKNSILMEDGRRYETSELSALIHLKGARTLGTYGEDFYQGEPAFTVNEFGRGKAYYLAARADEDFYRDLYRGLVTELEVKHAAEDELPEGVEACLRETEERRYLFLQNFSGREAEVKLIGAWERVDTGEPVKQAVLTGYDALTLRSSSK